MMPIDIDEIVHYFLRKLFGRARSRDLQAKIEPLIRPVLKGIAALNPDSIRPIDNQLHFTVGGKQYRARARHLNAAARQPRRLEICRMDGTSAIVVRTIKTVRDAEAFALRPRL